MKKRVISLVLCLLMALSLIPTTAFAVDADPSAEAGSTALPVKSPLIRPPHLSKVWSIPGTSP